MKVLIPTKFLMMVHTAMVMTVAIAGAQAPAWDYPKGNLSVLGQEARVMVAYRQRC